MDTGRPCVSMETDSFDATTVKTQSEDRHHSIGDDATVHLNRRHHHPQLTTKPRSYRARRVPNPTSARANVSLAAGKGPAHLGHRRAREKVGPRHRDRSVTFGCADGAEGSTGVVRGRTDWQRAHPSHVDDR
jgi:hypothetical protein